MPEMSGLKSNFAGRLDLKKASSFQVELMGKSLMISGMPTWAA